MAALPKLAVTGATGRIGGLVAGRLAGVGVTQRLLVRDAERAPRLPGAHVEVAAYRDFQAVQRALAGADAVFMVSASESRDRLEEHLTFVDASIAAGVGRIVYLSFFGAAADATFTLARDHWATENHIRGGGQAFTFLRDNLYLDFFPMMTGADGVIRGPADDGRAAAVAQEDIAAVAAAVLRDPQAHTGATYDLTGPDDLTLHDVAAALSELTGQPVTYHAETIEEAYASRAGYGAPAWQVDAWVSTYTAIAAGEMAGVTDTVERLTGYPPRSLYDVLRSRL